MSPLMDTLAITATTVWDMSWKASVVIGVVWLTRRLLGNRLHPGFGYALGLIVLVKLVLPVAPASEISLFNLFPLGQPVAASTNVDPTVSSAPIFNESAELGAALTSTPSQSSVAVPSGNGAIVTLQPNGPMSASIHFTPTRWAWTATWPAALSAIWLIGGLLFVSRCVWTYRAFARRLAADGYPADRWVYDLLDRTRADLGVRREVRLLETREVKTPALMGWWTPTILLPEGSSESRTRREMRHILTHELIHLNHHDIASNWLLIVIRAAHWFNPLVHMFCHAFIADREKLRDAQVIRRLTPGEQLSYGQTILNLALNAGRAHPHLVTAGLIQRPALIQQRIHMITKPIPYTVPRVALAGAVMTAVAAACLTGSPLAAQAADAEETAKPAAPAAPKPATKAKSGTRYEDLPLLDLRGMSEEDLRNIESIEDVALVIVSESNRGALGSVTIQDVATVLPLPDDAKVTTMTGQLKLGPEAFQGNDEKSDILLVVGQVIIEGDIDSVSYDEMFVVGQAVISEASYSMLAPHITNVTGQLIVVPGTPRVIFTQESIGAEFLELIDTPESLVVLGRLNIEDDVTSEQLRKKIASLHVFGMVSVPARLEATAQFLTKDKFGQISVRDE
ncbi:MAG: M56 family metallopeptidase [Planctomycetota bacterium]